MAPEPVDVDVHHTEPMSEEQLLWLVELEKELALVEQLAVVKSVSFIYSDKSHNLNKVQATLWCCWDGARRSFKQVLVACHEKERPTHFEALRKLHQTIREDHMCADHVHDPRAVARRTELNELPLQADSNNVFDRMKVAQAAQQLMRLKAEADARRLEEARQAEHANRQHSWMQLPRNHRQGAV